MQYNQAKVEGDNGLSRNLNVVPEKEQFSLAQNATIGKEQNLKIVLLQEWSLQKGKYWT